MTKTPTQVGLIGLGKMGFNLALRMHSLGIAVLAANRSSEPLSRLSRKGVKTVEIIKLPRELNPPRIIWLMVSAGQAVDSVIEALLPGLSSGDIVIDGGNSHYTDSVRRQARLVEKGVGFLDVGTSGGVEGALKGPCLMVGGELEVLKQAEPLLSRIAQPEGYLHVGPPGAGHYVKMVHNGVEYAMLQAYAEGFDLLHTAKYKIDLKKLVHNWRYGSVVRSWMLELLERTMDKDHDLKLVPSSIAGGETGQWTVEEARKQSVPVDSIALALKKRQESRSKSRFSGRIVMAIRRQYHGSDD